MIRWVNATPGGWDYMPRPDSHRDLDTCTVRFGSAHSSGFHAVCCDGSVQPINYDIEMRELELMARRNDGGVATID